MGWWLMTAIVVVPLAWPVWALARHSRGAKLSLRA